MAPIRVLHVDDDADLASLTARFLERERSNLTVETVTGPDAAADALDALDEGVDCIVSDYRMPGMDGLELLSAVRERYPDLPFILYTGKGSEAVASDAISAGVTDYLQKRTGSGQYELLANRIENAVRQRRAERDLHESRRRFRTLLGNLPGMAYRALNEPNWPMQFVSEGCRGLTGYDPQAILEGDVGWGEDVIHPEDRGTLWEPVQAALDARDAFQVDYRIVTADGETRWVWEQGTGVFEDDELVALEGFITDITERRRTTERLSAFADTVSHDLQNPLNVALAELESAAPAAEGEVADHVDGAVTALDRMDALLDELLDMVDDPDPDRAAPFDLSGVARDAWETVETGDATLSVSADATLVGDRDAAIRLLENLLRNSAEHGATGENPSVTVTVGPLPDGFYVADDGPGIPAEERERVFDPGYSTSEDGTGYGLVSVKRLVAAHGWTLDVAESEAGGARFEVTGVERRDGGTEPV